MCCKGRPEEGEVEFAGALEEEIDAVAKVGRGLMEGIRDPGFPPARDATGRRVRGEMEEPEAVAPPPPSAALKMGAECVEGDNWMGCG